MHTSIRKDLDSVAETPLFPSPFFETPITGSYPPASGELELCDESATTKFVVRADHDTAAARTLGVGLGPSRDHEGSGEADRVLISGQRPTEWLILGSVTAVEAMVENLDRAGHVSIIDLTHGRALLRLTGRDAPRVLEKICSLDLGEAMTPDGAAFSASVADVSCDIIRDDESDARSYRIACDRSFGQYLFETILDAGAEFGIAVGRIR